MVSKIITFFVVITFTKKDPPMGISITIITRDINLGLLAQRINIRIQRHSLNHP
jgi:hypothetical protein